MSRHRAPVVKHLPSRRILNLVVAAIVVAAVVALAVTRSGAPASAMRLLAGDAWLSNRAAGSVSHVNGYSGGTDAQAAVGKAGDPFQVVQRADGAYVLDLRTGRLSRLDDSSLSVTTAVMEPKPATALQVITGTSVTWILDQSSGVLQQVSPTTLKPVGHQIVLGGPTGTGVIDGSGSVWVPLRSKAEVVEVTPGGVVTHHAFGRAGDDIQIADTSGGVWALDSAVKKAASLSNPSAHPVALPPLANAPLVGASSSSPDLVLVSGGQVLNVDTAQPSLSSLAVPSASAVTQVAVSSGRAYLLDPQARRLETVNLSPIGVAASTPVPPGSDQLVAKDQLVFVNSTTTPQALVVNPDGAVTDVQKYNPSVPSRHSQSAPNTQPLPVPSATTVPSATPPQTNQAAPYPPSGTTPATAPVVTSPPQYSPPTTPAPTVPQITAPPVPVTAPPPATASPATAPPPTAPPTIPPTTAPPTTPPTTAAPTVPGVPSITGVTGGNGQVTATWSAPASDGGSPVVSYNVTWSPTTKSMSVAAATTTATITGLGAGTNECVQVQAVNKAGAGPFSPAGAACAKTPSPPGAVSNLSVTGGDDQLTVNWGEASVPAGSPGVSSYQVSVGGTAHSTGPGSTSLTVSATAWSNEAVKVYAVNSVGNGPTASGSGMAWARSTSVVTCIDSLSGDHAYQNDCTNLGGAWSQVNSSPISWINAEGGAGGHTPSGNFEGLCTTYYSGTEPGEVSGKPWSGDVYGLANAPTDSACANVLPYAQSPDYSHIIAAVSTSSLPGGQHVCEYKGLTSGANGQFTQEELSVCGSVPSGMSSASEVNNFYT